MTKEQWQEVYSQLDRIYSEFCIEFHTSNKGKNKQIRAAADRKVDSLIRRADFHIRQHNDVLDLATGGPGNSDYDKTIQYDEFLQPRYFKGDLPELLEKIREKINSQK